MPACIPVLLLQILKLDYLTYYYCVVIEFCFAGRANGTVMLGNPSFLTY
jgi:hypothetical protein